MGTPDDESETVRMADNLRRTIELTELALALRCAVLQQDAPQSEAMTTVMHEIRCAKVRAWERNP